MKSLSSTIPLLLASASLSSATAPNPGSDWKKTLFLDDFTGGKGAPPSSNNWILQTGTQYPGGPTNWGTQEVETYTTSPNNVQQNGNGYLLITPLKSSSGQWTSARVESASSSFAAPAKGKMRIEASLQLPNVTAANGKGYWPAFWALGAGMRKNVTSWPGVGEFDIMEHVNALKTVNQGLHCGTGQGGPCNEPSGIAQSSACPSGDAACTNAFHTYTLVLDRSTSPEALRWYVDLKLQYTVTASQIGADAWAAATHHGFYLILNVAMGGAFPKYANGGVDTPTADTVAGKSMKVDYVAVWTT